MKLDIGNVRDSQAQFVTEIQKSWLTILVPAVTYPTRILPCLSPSQSSGVIFIYSAVVA